MHLRQHFFTLFLLLYARMAVMDRVCVIVNPMSARGRTALRWPRIQHFFSHHFREFCHHLTESPTQATDLTRERLKEGYDLIVGVGGDGTLSEISNGFFTDQGSIINPDAALGIIPSGTGSDMIRSLHIPRDFRQSIEQIKTSRPRPLDLGICHFTAPDGSRRTRHFINVADVGLGARVIHHLEKIPAARRGPFTYYSGLFSCLRDLQAHPLTLTIGPEKERREGKFIIAALANGSVFGGGMIIAPEAQPDDGVFDLILVEEMPAWRVLANTPRLYRGSITRHPRVSRITCREVTLESPQPCPLEMDGEAVGYLPATFTLLPRAVNFRG